MSRPEVFAGIFRRRMERSFWREQSYVLALDSSHHELGLFLVGVGNECSCPVPTSTLFKQVLGNRKCRACTSIIVAHNHPSGSLTPSREDFDVTRKVFVAGRYLELDLLDHLVVTKGGFTSIRRERPDLFSTEGL